MKEILCRLNEKYLEERESYLSYTDYETLCNMINDEVSDTDDMSLEEAHEYNHKLNIYISRNYSLYTNGKEEFIKALSFYEVEFQI